MPVGLDARVTEAPLQLFVFNSKDRKMYPIKKGPVKFGDTSAGAILLNRILLAATA